MDEPIWIFIGVIAAIIGLGVIASVVLRSQDSGMQEQVRAAVDTLGVQCNQVCGLPENTALTVKIDVPKDAIITTSDDRICGESVAADTARSCSRCACSHDAAIVLNTSGAGAFYQSHTFSCRYTRVDTKNTGQRVMVNCSG